MPESEWSPQFRREYLSGEAVAGDDALSDFHAVRDILEDLEAAAVDAVLIPGEDLHRGVARIWAVRALRRELLERVSRGTDAKARLLESP